jgi:hypothetical protein
MVIGRIYKIVSGEGNECYLGSTFNKLKYRFKQHKNDYRRWKDGNRGSCASFDLFEKYEIKNCKMLLIKEYDVIDRKHLQVYETLWICKLKSINKNVSFRIPYLDRKYYKKKRLHNNPNFYKEQYQKFMENHPDYIKEKYKKTLKNNPQHNREKYEKYGEKQKVRQSEKINCEICSCQIRRNFKSRHQRSKKHQSNLAKQPIQ